LTPRRHLPSVSIVFVADRFRKKALCVAVAIYAATLREYSNGMHPPSGSSNRIGAAKSGHRKSLEFKCGSGRHCVALLLRHGGPPMPDPEFKSALRRYARIREVAFVLARAKAESRSGVEAPFRFEPIDQLALDAWQSTLHRPQPFGHGGWNWAAVVRPVWRRPCGFSLALWSESQLCGMMVGRVSRRRRSGRRHTLSLPYLEGNPDRRHPLRACGDRGTSPQQPLTVGHAHRRGSRVPAHVRWARGAGAAASAADEASSAPARGAVKP